ncbi:hypothetical protein IscW_ISCW021059, partial [Ixodes scapularis]
SAMKKIYIPKNLKKKKPGTMRERLCGKGGSAGASKRGSKENVNLAKLLDATRCKRERESCVQREARQETRNCQLIRLLPNA